MATGSSVPSGWRWAVRGSGRRSAVVIVVTLAGCAPASPSGSDPPVSVEPSAVAEATPSAESTPSPTFALERFPDFPTGGLPGSIAKALQAELDARIEAGTFSGVTAAVIVADRGSWTGAAGSAGGTPLTPDSRTPTHSVGKTIVASQILRLAEDGMLDLDDPASEHLPPELGWYDANGATIRQLLGMRAGIPDVPGADNNYYPAEEAQTAVELFRMLPEPTVPPGGEPGYSDLNFVLLGTIIEHLTGRPLGEALRSDVLDDPALDGLDYTVGDALAGDGWGVESTPASMARWGYELYGGSVVSDASLGEMTDFQGEWYGLGTMDFSEGGLGVGHFGISSPTTCCSASMLAALPAEGIVISVQASFDSSSDPLGQVDLLARLLRDAALP